MAPHTRRTATARRLAASRGRAAGGAVAVLLLALAACGDDGRDLSEPDPSQTTTTATTPVAAGSSEGSGAAATEAVMRLSSPDFTEGSAMPAANTCAGDDLSPALTLTGVPAGTADVAVVVRDIDADGFVHWVVTNIPAQGGGLQAGAVPEGAIQATNDFGTLGWRGPCPPSGTHHYDIRAYALAAPSGVTPGMPGKQAATLVESAEYTAVAALGVTATAASAG
jgi:Raf kinase inhibitor-like YbhB/YbcL family protein